MKNLPILNGEHVYLRPFQKEDAEIYSSWLKDAELRRLADEEERSIEELITYQEQRTQNERYIEYIIVNKSTKKPIGDACINLGREKPLCGLMIAYPENRREGYGRDCVKVLLKFARNQLGLEEIYAEVFPFNVGAQKFHESIGMKKLGSILDDKGKECILYVMRLDKDFSDLQI
ncbi:MAG: GNAT family protein [Candidatus Aenigmatarchaeota archaeon]